MTGKPLASLKLMGVAQIFRTESDYGKSCTSIKQCFLEFTVPCASRTWSARVLRTNILLFFEKSREHPEP